jgi:hypothetical protein
MMKSFGDGLPMGNIVYPQLMSLSSEELFLYSQPWTSEELEQSQNAKFSLGQPYTIRF